jgi:hypothetical protein
MSQRKNGLEEDGQSLSKGQRGATGKEIPLQKGR